MAKNRNNRVTNQTNRSNPSTSTSPATSTSSTSTTPATNASSTSTTPARTAQLVPTVHTMIVCVPAELPAEALVSRQLDKHFGVSGTLSPRFWATPSIWVWQRSQLVDPRKGQPVYCAGGPAKLLDLAGMRHAAAVGASVRYQMWSRVVQGTRPATPWPQLLQQHIADPAKLSLDDAIARYNNQPRVIAMRMHNAVTYGAGQLNLRELEMFQAGPMAYQHYSATTALTADTLITADGTRLAPASDAFAHRVTYLEQANRYLANLDEDQRLLAVAL
ncbi:hypothetical protein OHA72_10555 [Dactylosporangium sp. NBC_01737]|uniref:hypothetical protein n=1 Tax=Dactylosporangium sp. NBC_01737 TaxID=2975959 RepID=UPI002E0E44EF|nr:hypothetical protein OHA72_10555 [Dactylosporangium sp. NBC_01737]